MPKNARRRKKVYYRVECADFTRPCGIMSDRAPTKSFSFLEGITIWVMIDLHAS